MKCYYILKNKMSRVAIFLTACLLLTIGNLHAQLDHAKKVTNSATFITALGGIDNAYCRSVASSGEYEIVLKKDVIVADPIIIEGGKYWLHSDGSEHKIQYIGEESFITISTNSELRLGNGNSINEALILQGATTSSIPSALHNHGKLTLLSSLSIKDFGVEKAIINNVGENADLLLNGATLQGNSSESGCIIRQSGFSANLQDGSINGDNGMCAIYHLSGNLQLNPDFLLNNLPIRLAESQFVSLAATPSNGQQFHIQYDTLQFCTPYIVLDQDAGDLNSSILSSFHFQLPNSLIPYTNEHNGISIYKLIIKNNIDTCHAYYYEDLDSTITASTDFFERDSEDCEHIFYSSFIIRQDYIKDITTHLLPEDLPFQFDTLSTHEPGTYTFQYESSMYCDSIITITLYLDSGVFIYDTVAICMSEAPFSYYGDMLSESGDYDLYKFSSNYCDTIRKLNLTILPLPEVEITGRGNACQGENIILTASENSGYRYLWSQGSTLSSATVSTSGSYSVTVTDGNECSQTAMKEIDFTPVPNIVITHNANPYSFDITTIVASGGSEYLWSTGENSDTIRVAEAGTYRVTVSTGEFCSRNSSVTISDYTPNLEITGRRAICLGDTVSLTAIDLDDPSTTFLWSTGETTSSITVTPAASTSYTVTATNSRSVTNAVNATVSICDIESYKIIGSPIFCENAAHALSIPGVGTCLWNTGETTSTIHITQGGEYRVTFTTPEGCVGMDSIITSTIAKPAASINASGPTTFCDGKNVTLQADGGVSYFWNTGEITRNITVSEFGKYIVTVTGANGCSDTASRTIYVNASPEVQFSTTDNICAGQQVVIEGYGSTDYTYSWRTGETSSIFIDNPTANSIYLVTVTGSNGCMKEYRFNVTVHPLPNVTISGETQICQGDTTTISAYGADSYVWSTRETTNEIKVFGGATYYVTATGEGGCTKVFSHELMIMSAPTPSITGNASFCEGGQTVLTVNNGNSYAWSTNENTPSITVNQPNIYTVTVTYNNGCQKEVSKEISMISAPAIQIVGARSFCANTTHLISASGDTDNTYNWSTGERGASINIYTGGTYTVTATNTIGCKSSLSASFTTWDMPNLVISGEENYCENDRPTLYVTPTEGLTFAWNTNATGTFIQPTATGEYTVTATNRTTGCSQTVSKTVVFHPVPTIQISGDSNLCVGRTTTLTATTTQPSSGIQYAWNTAQTTPYITVTPTNTTTYSVTATDITSGCSSNKSLLVSVNPIPAPYISGQNAICPGGSTTLTAGGGATYLWSNGATTAATTVSPSSNTTYTVTVTNAALCSATTSVNISINPMPVITFAGNTSFCAGLTTEVTAQGGTTYLWSNGDINARTTFTEAGIYTVTVTNGLGCSQSAPVSITENPIPNVTISGLDTLCIGNTVILSASGGNTYLWTTGESSASINVSPMQNTSYTVTATNEFNCTNSANITLTVNPLPNVAISGSSQGCQGESVTLTAVGGETYFWNTGEQTATLSATVQGTYIVTATNAHGCYATASKLVTFNAVPTPAINGLTNFCDGALSTLTANGGTSYLWNTGSTSVSITVGDANTYTVTVTNADGCSATTSVTTTLLAAPQIIISGEKTLCQGETTTLYATGGVTYQWSDGGTTNSLTVSPNTTTIYSITATNHLSCSASMEVEVIVNPVYSIHYDDAICIDNAYQRYGFNLPVQDSAGIFIYTQNLTSVNGCDSIITLALTVNPKPIITERISGNEFVNIAGNYTYIINNVQHANAYQWSISNPNWTLAPSSGKNVVLEINTPGSGILTVLAVNNCGLSESSSLSIVSNIVSIDDYEQDLGVSFFPNPTTNYITVKNEHTFSIHIEIYDMNGKLIHQSESIEQEAQISTTDLASGNYILRIVGNNGILGSRKMVKM